VNASEAAPTPQRCRHCPRDLTGLKRVRRGLCPRCYADPEVRARYPQTGTLAGLGGESARERDQDDAPPPPAPTDAPPGSRRKRLVLRERAALRPRVSLFHPGDAPLAPGRRRSFREQVRRRLLVLMRRLLREDPGLLDQLHEASAQDGGRFRPRKAVHKPVGVSLGGQS
jgi:hypothetical protein